LLRLTLCWFFILYNGFFVILKILSKDFVRAIDISIFNILGINSEPLPGTWNKPELQLIKVFLVKFWYFKEYKIFGFRSQISLCIGVDASSF